VHGDIVPGAPLWRGLRIGVLGGSFNPAHAGHAYVSELALARLGLDAVWWLVSPQNPLKPAAGMADLRERLAAARALASHPRIVVSDLERRLGTRYTADTLAALRRRWPATTFIWLMGADNLAQIPAWQRWSQIFNTTVIAAFARKPYDSNALAGRAAQRFRRARLVPGRARSLGLAAPPAWVFLPVRHHPESASAIRARHGGGGGPETAREVRSTS